MVKKKLKLAFLVCLELVLVSIS